MDSESDFITMTEASVLLGISRATASNWAKTGKLTVYQKAVNRREKLVHRDEVEILSVRWREAPGEHTMNGEHPPDSLTENAVTRSLSDDSTPRTQPEEQSHDEFLTLKMAHVITNIALFKLRKLIAKGELPTYISPLNRRHILLRRSDVVALLTPQLLPVDTTQTE